MPTTLPILILIPALLAAPPISVDSHRPPPPPTSQHEIGWISAGAGGLGLGVVMFAFMGDSLRRGDAQRVAHNDVVSTATGNRRPLTSAERTELAGIDHLGRIDNRTAIGLAIAGAIAMVVGAVLLGRGLKLRRRARLAASGSPHSVGLALRF